MRRSILLKVIAVQEVVGGAAAPLLFSFMLVELARAGFPVDQLAPSGVVTALFLLRPLFETTARTMLPEREGELLHSPRRDSR